MALDGCTAARTTHVDLATASRPPAGGLPSGLPSSTLWSTRVTWSRVDAVHTGLPARIQWPADVGPGIPDPTHTMMAVTGDVVVAATTRPGAVTLRFINAKTGALIAARSLAVSSFTGIRADTIGGEPVVETQYAVTEHDGDGPSQSFTDTVFDTSGRQVWTNGGREPSDYAAPGLLVNNADGLVTGGHTLWFNPGTDALHHGGSYTVQDLSGNALLTVPYWASIDPANPMEGTINGVQLAGGYAVVIHGGPGKTAAAAPHARFTVYDLSRGAKVVAAPTVTFPEGPNLAHPEGPNPDPTANVVAACGGKLVLALTDASWTGPSSARLTVLDVATGQTTPPVDVPSVVKAGTAGALSGLADASCSTMILTGPVVLTGRVPASNSIAIDLSRGTLLWQKFALNATYHYLSIHDGVIYALRDPTLTTQGRLIAISAASGATLGTGYTAVPLAYTADGTPILARVPHDPAPAAPSPSQSVSQYSGQPAAQLSPSVDVQLWAG